MNLKNKLKFTNTNAKTGTMPPFSVISNQISRLLFNTPYVKVNASKIYSKQYVMPRLHMQV